MVALNLLLQFFFFFGSFQKGVFYYAYYFPTIKMGVTELVFELLLLKAKIGGVLTG